jgi:NDP-sugar pyrophosphorylase family protein
VKAVILAAGFGNRLKPLTYFRAKAAMPLLNVPLLFYNLNFLRKEGIEDIIINLHYLPHSIEHELKKYHDASGCIKFSYEPSILGTAGALKKVKFLLGKNTFLVINGDILFNLDIEKALAFHSAKGALATMMVVPRPIKKSYTPVFLDGQDRIVRIGNENGKGCDELGKWVFCGIQILEAEIFRYITKDGFSDIIKDFYLPAIRNEEPIFGFKSSGFWQEVGTPGDYVESHAQLFALGSKSISQIWNINCDIKGASKFNREASTSSGSMVHGSSVEIRGGLTIKDWAVLGKDCHVDKDCTIGSSIFFDKCSIGEGSYIHNSIVFEGVTIAPASTINNSIIMPKIPPLTSLKNLQEIEGNYLLPLQ